MFSREERPRSAGFARGSAADASSLRRLGHTGAPSASRHRVLGATGTLSLRDA